MESYGCDRGVGLPPGLDRQLTMCTHTFFNCRWVNDTTLIKTADRPEDYTTRYVYPSSYLVCTHYKPPLP
jgi:hypothetical protein